VSLAFWGQCWGFIGMFLAVPLTVVAKIVLEQLEFTRPFAELLGDRAAGGEPGASAALRSDAQVPGERDELGVSAAQRSAGQATGAKASAPETSASSGG
jgi:hypothetical protein